MNRLIPVAGLLLALVAGSVSAGGIYPIRPTIHDDVYVVLTYPCPYPVNDLEPTVVRDGDRIDINIVTAGSTCFDNSLVDVDYAINLGKLEAGKYKAVVTHSVWNGVSTRPVPTGQELTRRFIVKEDLPTRISGAWFFPEEPGQQLHVSLIDGARAYVEWATYDNEGKQIWLAGVGERDGLLVNVDLMRTSGGRFNAYDPDQVSVFNWGSAQIDFSSCDSATITWVPTDARFAAGQKTINQGVVPLGLGGCEPPNAYIDWWKE